MGKKTRGQWPDLEQREEKIEGRNVRNRWAVLHKFICKLVVWNRDEAMWLCSVWFKEPILHIV